MSDEQLQQLDWEQADWVQAAPFQPSAGLRVRLLWACFATLLGGLLGVASFASQDETVEVILGVASILPLGVMLAGYLLLAKELGSLGLRRTTLGMLGLLALGSLASLAVEQLVGKEAAIAIVVVLILGVVVLLGVVAHRPAWAELPLKTGETTSTQQKAGWGGGLGFLIMLKVLLFRRALRPLFGGNWDLETVIDFTSLGLLVLLIIFSFSAGIVKLRLGGRLGLTSMLLGLTELLAPLVLLGLLVAFCFDIVAHSEAAGPLEQDQQAVIEQRLEAWKPTAMAIGIGIHAAWTIMTVLFFWSVRGGADPEEVLPSAVA